MTHSVSFLRSKSSIFAGATASLFHTIFFAVVMWPLLLKKDGLQSDYTAHFELAEAMLAQHKILSPHFLYQIIMLAINWVLMNPGLLFSAFIASLLFNFTFGLLVFKWVQSKLDKASYWIPFLASIIIMTVTPITLFTWNIKQVYQGYLYLNSFHNPTLTCLKPLSALVFILVIRSLENTKIDLIPKKSFSTFISMCLLAFAMSLSILAKPNFAICFLPGLGLYLMIRQFLLKMKTPWIPLILGVFLPSILILYFQYEFSYGHGSSQVIFAPLYVFSLSSKWLLAKFLLSILFPLTFSILFWKEERNEVSLQLVWLVFIFGAFYTYFLAESGPRMDHGNFAWSGQISQTLLFMVCISLFAKYIQRYSYENSKTTKKLAFCATILVMHFISGIFWWYLYFSRQIGTYL